MYDQQQNDYELLYLIYQKDDESLTLLIQKYEKLMYVFFQTNVSLMYRIKGYVDEYQIGRLVILKAIENFRDDKDVTFRHYYFCLLRNEMLNIVRRNQMYFQSKLISSEYLMYECSSDYLEDILKDNRADMQANWLIHCDDVKSQIAMVEENLSDIERKILRLRLYGYSYQEIAKVLHINLKKVDNTLCKIRNHKV